MSNPEKVRLIPELVARFLTRVGLRGFNQDTVPVPGVLTEGREPIIVVPEGLGDDLLRSFD